MARITVFPNGVTASHPRLGTQELVAKRGKVKGWSLQATGRLRRWLYSVDGDALDGRGFGLTLTVRHCPPTAAEWTATVKRFLMRVKRAGAVRGQWLIEWQRRGVPHLHGILYFPGGVEGYQELVVGHWLAAAAEWGPRAEAQHVVGIWGLPGWLQYQAKHSARGVRHYQRANVPEEWQEGTGRLWGRFGAWPVREEVVTVSSHTFHRFRRLVRSWLVGQAREELSSAQAALWSPRRGEVDVKKAVLRERAALARLLYLERMLRCPDKKLSPVRAVGEFCPEAVARRFLAIAELREGV